MVLEASFLGLLPRDIRHLRPYELALVLEGRRRREKEKARMIAWQIAWTVNCWSEKPVSVDEVMGEADTRTSGGSDAASLFAFAEQAEREREAAAAAEAAGWADAFEGSLLDDVDIESLLKDDEAER